MSEPRSRAALGVASVAVAVSSRAAAAAALSVSLRVDPEQPWVGQLATVELRTFVPRSGAQCLVDRTPWRLRYPFRVEAVAPSGAVRRVPVRLAPRGNVYRGTLRPTSAGRWTIRVAHFAPRYDRCSGARLVVRVRA